MFDEIHHADWSTGASKRWVASARRSATAWTVSGPRRVGPSDAFLDSVVGSAGSKRVLAGFDFPVGLPVAYGQSTGFTGFREALQAFGRDPGWEGFFDVARLPEEVAPGRPFYPRTATKGVSRAALVDGLGVTAFADLLRECERGGPGRRQACSIFWTLGGNQVGRAATSGWVEIVRPAILRGASIWPFDGELATLSGRGGLVMAETYPADAYALLGAPFGSRESKTSQVHRRSKAAPILEWAATAGVDVGEARAPLLDGFGASKTGEDPFDAFVGLLAMIAVVDGSIPEATVLPAPEVAAWEGWILGR